MLKYIAFSLLGVILLLLVFATVLEKMYGTSFVDRYVYDSFPFVALWIVWASVSVIYLFLCKMHKHPVILLIHLSFVFILTGAFVSWLSSEHGVLQINKGEHVSSFVDDNGHKYSMPFLIELKDFQILYYTGTHAPMNFISEIKVFDGNKKIDGRVSMNKIFTYRGYRFYQSGYDTGGAVSLSVAHDPYGIAITYVGYTFLLFSFVCFFFNRRSRFYSLLHNPLITRGAAICFLLLYSFSFLRAEVKPKVLPQEVAARFGDIRVMYNDRICPLQTMAKDFTMKLYGSPSYKGYSSEQVLTGWMFYYSSWKDQPMIKIKSSYVRQLLGIKGKYASFDDFTDDLNGYKLKNAILESQYDKRSKDSRTIEEVDEKYNLVASLNSGKLLKIFPYPFNNDLVWYSQADLLPETMSRNEWFFVKKSLSYLSETIMLKEYKRVSLILEKLGKYQEKNAKGTLPSAQVFKAEKIYNRLHYTWWASILCISMGFMAFVYYCYCLSNRTGVNKRVSMSAVLVLYAVFLYLTVVLVLRWFVSGHIPLSNGFETMQFMSWSVVGLSLLLHKRYSMLLPFGILLCGLTLMVSMIGESNPQITQLMPVLSSPLLSIHVAVIMLAYSLFAFVMLNGVTAIILYARNRDNLIPIERLQIISRIILYPAVFCLAIGIFVGAVWANISWGRYWSWDPKETWALITFLVYSLALHPGSLPLFRKPLFFHVFTVLSFLIVLMTYFGVNFVLGGMHSYASS